MSSRVQTVVELVAAGGAVTLLSLEGKDTVFDAPNARRSSPYLMSSPTVSMAFPSGDGATRGYVGGIMEARISGQTTVRNPRNILDNARINDGLLDLRFERTTCTIYTTSRENPAQDLTDPNWSSFKCKVERLAGLGIGVIELQLEPLVDLLEDEQLGGVPEYWALGDACLIIDLGDSIGIASGSNLEPSLTASWCYELVGVTLLGGDLVNNAVWFKWGNGSTTGIRLMTDVGGNANIRLEVFGLSTDTITSANDVLTEAGGPYTVAWLRDVDKGVISIYLNGEKVASAASTGTITDPAPASLALGNDSSQWSAAGEFRTHDIAPSDSQLASLHMGRIEVPTPGLVEVNRDGASLVWPATIDSPANDLDLVVNTPTFGYGFEGPLSYQGKTHPRAYGRDINVEPIFPHVANFVGEVSGGEVTDVVLHQRGTLRADPADYKANFVSLTKAAPGLILFIVDPRPMSGIRLSFNAGTFTGQELLEELLFVDGPIPLSATATEFVHGIALDAEVAHYLDSQQGPIQTRPVVEEVCIGLDCVLMTEADGGFFVQRTPPLDFAVDPDGGEVDAVLRAGVDFSEGDADGRGGGLGQDGDGGPGYYNSRWQFARTVHVIDPKDINLSNPPDSDTEAQNSMLVPHQEVLFDLGPSAQDAIKGRREGASVPGLHVFRADALADAKRRATGVLSLGGSRVFNIRQLREDVPGLRQLGARVVLHSGVIDAAEGLPFILTSMQMPQDKIELLELRLARMQPDEIVNAANFNAAVDEIDDHPLLSSPTFADTTASPATLRIGFPAPPKANTGVSWQFRVRLKAAGSVASTIAIALSEADLTIGALKVEILSGPGVFSGGIFLVEPGDTAVFAADFDPTDVTNLEDLECFVTVTGTVGHVGQISGIDYLYQVR